MSSSQLENVVTAKAHKPSSRIRTHSKQRGNTKIIAQDLQLSRITKQLEDYLTSQVQNIFLTKKQP